MEVDYYSKYIKYKAKYVELKKQMGGNSKPYNPYECCIFCNCKEYIFHRKINEQIDEKIYETEYCKCNHKKIDHDENIFKNFYNYRCNREYTETGCCMCNCVEYKNSNTQIEKSNCTCNHEHIYHLPKKYSKCRQLIKYMHKINYFANKKSAHN